MSGLGLASGEMNASVAHSSMKDDDASFVLAYHEILPEASEYLYHVSVDGFAAQLEHFDRRRSAGEAQPSLKITFDDGHSSQVLNALPQLDRFDRKAMFFVLPGLMGKDPAALSWSDARRLIDDGHEVGSHGWSHRLLTLCSPRDLALELSRSKEELEFRLGRQVTAISAPGGRWNVQVAAECARCGYETLFHSDPWSPVRKLHGVSVRGRLMVTGKMTGSSIDQLAGSGAVSRLSHRAKQRVKLGVRALLGEQRYHSLWCRLAGFRQGDGLEVESSREGTVNR